VSLSFPALVAASLATFLAAVIQGLTGFGLALVQTPLLFFFLPPTTVVPVRLIHAIVSTMAILSGDRRHLQLRRIWPLMLAATLSMPLGTYLLLALEVEALKVLTGAVIVLFGLAFLRGLHWQIRDERLASVVAGLLSGILGGSTGMSGPPVVLLFHNQSVEKSAFRANLVAFFLVLNLTTLPVYLLGGLLTIQVVRYAALLLPSLLLGAAVGVRLANRIDPRTFRTATLVIVILAGALSIASGLNLL
jgi:uncharacterized membrane protein YfcA